MMFYSSMTDDMADLAERLHAVRVASRRFLELYAIEDTVILPGLDRISADLEQIREIPTQSPSTQ